MRNRRVLISGASVAGPTLAFWLSRFGFEVTVLEQAPGMRPGGYAVDFRGTSMRILERMGLVDAVKALQTRTGSGPRATVPNMSSATPSTRCGRPLTPRR